MDEVRLPAGAVRLLAALRIAGAAALLVLVSLVFASPPLDAWGWALALGLTAFLVVLLRFPIVYTWRSQVATAYADETVAFASIVLLSPTAMAAILFLGHAVEQVAARRVWLKSSTNAAITALTTLAAAAAATVLLEAGVWPVAAAAVGVVVYTLGSSIALAVVLAAVEEATLWGALVRSARIDLLNVALGVGAGVVAVALWGLHPVAIVLLVPAVFGVRRFLALSAASRREQEVREAVAAMAEALAGSAEPERAADAIAACSRAVFTPGRVVVDIGGVRRVLEEPGHVPRLPALEEQLATPDGRALGFLRIEPSRRDASGFGASDAALLRILAGASSSAAQNVLAVREAREAQARLAEWLEHAHDAVAIVDPEGRIEYANPAASRLLGARAGALAKDVLPQTVTPEGEGRARGEAGETFVAVGSTALPSGSRLVIARDVSEARRRRESEAALLHAERLATIGSLTAGVGHEINNALTLVVARLDLARLTVALARESGTIGSAVAADLDKYHDSLDSAMERITTIAGSLRAAARKRSGTSVRLDAAVEEVLTLADVRLRPDVAVERSLAAVPPVRSEGGEVSQILLNLVLNAADAMRAQGGGTLRVATRAEGGFAVVTVADTGPGIPADVQERIFETFFTTKPNGTGLGLALSRRLARENGGDLTFSTEPGHGTVFALRLPLAEA